LVAFFFGKVGKSGRVRGQRLKLIMDERKRRLLASCVSQLTLFLILSRPLLGAANEACKSPNQGQKNGNGNGNGNDGREIAVHLGSDNLRRVPALNLIFPISVEFLIYFCFPLDN